MTSFFYESDVVTFDTVASAPTRLIQLSITHPRAPWLVYDLVSIVQIIGGISTLEEKISSVCLHVRRKTRGPAMEPGGRRTRNQMTVTVTHPLYTVLSVVVLPFCTIYIVPNPSYKKSPCSKLEYEVHHVCVPLN